MKKKQPACRHRLLDADMAEKGFVNAATAAELLRTAISAVHRMCDDGVLEHVRVGKRPDGKMARVFIKREALRKYLGPEVAKILKV